MNGEVRIGAFLEEFESFKPEDAESSGNKAEEEIIRVKEGEMEELAKEGNVENQEKERQGSPEDPAQSDVGGSQGGPDGPRP